MPEQPFVGPRPFESRDQALFFGRDQEAGQLFDLVYAEPCCVLYSRSGLGKSSLIHAGLRPRLEQEGWQVLPTARVMGGEPPSVDHNPFVWGVIESSSKRAPGADSAARTLEDHLSQCAAMPGTGILLVLDQFEELFTLPGTNAQRKEFFLQLGKAVSALSTVRVLISIREEFLADLESYKRYIPRQLTGRLRLNLLSRSAAILALDRPLQYRGITMEPEAMNALLDLLTQERVYTADRTLREISGEEVEPVHLQIVAFQLWESLPAGATRLTLQNVRGLQQRDPLSSFYKECIESASRETSIRSARILKWCRECLITPAGTRALVYAGADGTAGMSTAVVSALEQKHLLRTELRAGAKWIELAHDQFIRPVEETYDEWERQIAGAIGRARAWIERAQEWDSAGRTSRTVLSQQEIDEAESFLVSDEAEDIGGRALLEHFIDYSKHAQERAIRRSRMLRLQITTLTFFLVFAVVFAWWAFAQKRKADLQTQNAESQTVEARKQAAYAKEQAAYGKRQNDLATELYQKSVDALKAQQKLELDKEKLLEKLHDIETLTATAYQLKLRSEEIRDISNDASLQKKLNLAWLAAQVTFSRDHKTITPDADEAMRAAWPSVANGQSSSGITGTIADNGAFYLVQLKNTVFIYKIPNVILWKTVDLDKWIPSPLYSQLSSEGSRLLILSVGFEQAVVLDLSGDTPQPIFDKKFPKYTYFNANPAMTTLIARAPPVTVSPTSFNSLPRVAVWDVDSQTQIASLSHSDRFVLFSRNDRIISLNSDGSILAWDKPYETSTTLADSGYTDIRDLSVLNDGSLIFVSNDGRILKLEKDGSKKTELTTFEFPHDAVYPYLSVSADPDRPVVLLLASWRDQPYGSASSGSGHSFHHTRTYNLADGSTTTFVEDPNSLWGTRFLRDGSIATPGSDGTLKILKPDSPPESLQIVPRSNYGISLSSRALSMLTRDGVLSLLVPSASGDPSPAWKSGATKLTRTGVSAILSQPADNNALVAYSDGRILLGDLISGDVTRTYQHGAGLFDIAVSPDWTSFASVGTDGRLCLWNLSSDHPVREIQAHQGAIRAVAVSHDGSLVVTAGEDNRLKIWKTHEENNVPSETFQTDASVNALILRNDDLVAGAEDGSVTKWNIKTGHSDKIRWAIGSKFPVYALALSPDGSRLAVNAPDANGGNNALHVLDFPSGEPWLRIEQYTSPVRRVTFDSNGANVVGISENGQVRIDPLSSVDLMTRLGKLIKKPFTHDECLAYAATAPSICPAQ